MGKTVITLTAVNELKYNQLEISKVLIIAPKKVAESTWTTETAKWDHLKHLRVIRVLGTATQRMRALASHGDVYVINRENVPWLVEYSRNAWPFDMVVIDEFSSFKSRQAKRWKCLTWVRPHIRRIIGLTGTPAPNGLEDLWAQIYLLDGGVRLGRTITAYRDMYFSPGKRSHERIFTYDAKEGAEDAVKEKISDICVSMKAEDYLQLPDCLSVTVPVVLSDKAAAAYKKLERDMLLEIDEQTVDAGSAAVLTNKLLQLCNGAVYDEDGAVMSIHDDKVEAFSELLEGLNGQPALVFYSFRHDLPRLEAVCKKQELRYGSLKTEDDIQRWNSKELDVLFAHPASAAYGLNLQEGGNHVVWFGLTWSLELYQQANARLYRQGQTEKVIIHHLVVESGVDADVMEALESKSGTQEAVMQALKARIEKVKHG